MGTVVHVELTAQDVVRVAGFYEQVLGWRATPSPFVPDYHVLETGEGDGADAAVMARSYQAQPTIAWAQVADIDATRDLVVRNGGTLVADVAEIPGQGRVCYVADPEGTVLGLKEPRAAGVEG